MRPTPRALRGAPLLLLAATACSDPLRPVGPDGVAPPPGRAVIAAAATQTITLVSGAGPAGTLDPATQFSVTRDGTYENAPIVAGHPAYWYIPGTRYVSNSPTSTAPPGGSAWYRTTFELPATCGSPSLTVSIHADNAGTVYLNGTMIGQQPQMETFANFQGAPESYTTSDPALFVCGGTNVIEFHLVDYGNPTALDYKAVVTYELAAQAITFTSTPPSPASLGGSYAVSATGGGSGNPVVFSSLTPSVCTVSGTVVSLDALGVCTVAADQAGAFGYAAAPQVTQSFSVVWPFGGFRSPVAGEPALNSAKAGQAIPLKFSLSGDRGLAILAAGYPVSSPMACDASAVSSVLDETLTAGNSTLSYDPASDLYSYVWKTDVSWAGTCRRLTLRLSDGAEHVAYFSFRR